MNLNNSTKRVSTHNRSYSDNDDDDTFYPERVNEKTGLKKYPFNLNTEKQKEEEEDIPYTLKLIYFKSNNPTPILLQHTNGPCPLIAVANLLLLRHDLCIPEFIQERGFILNSEILQAIFDVGINKFCPQLDFIQKKMTIQHDLSVSNHSIIDDALDQLPLLSSGMNVNCKFNHIEAFEFTKELSIFDLFKISLVHGWVINDSLENESSIGCLGYIQNFSYNHIIDTVTRHEEILTLLKDVQPLIDQAWELQHTLDTLIDAKRMHSTNELKTSIHRLTQSNELKNNQQSSASLDKSIITAHSITNDTNVNQLVDMTEHQTDDTDNMSSPTYFIVHSPKSTPKQQVPILNDQDNVNDIIPVIKNVLDDLVLSDTHHVQSEDTLNDERHIDLPMINDTDFPIIYGEHDIIRFLLNNITKDMKQLGIHTTFSDDILSFVFGSQIDTFKLFKTNENNETISIDLETLKQMTIIANTITIKIRALFKQLWDIYIATIQTFKTQHHNVHSMNSDPYIVQINQNEITQLFFSLTDFIVDGWRLRDFLDCSMGQLTVTGFHQLHQLLNDQELTIFFRNSHFTVLYKYNSHLYQLVTDIGFVDCDDIVWERLDDIYGNTVFVDIHFSITNTKEIHQHPLYSSSTPNKFMKHRRHSGSAPSHESFKIKNAESTSHHEEPTSRRQWSFSQRHNGKRNKRKLSKKCHIM